MLSSEVSRVLFMFNKFLVVVMTFALYLRIINSDLGGNARSFGTNCSLSLSLSLSLLCLEGEEGVGPIQVSFGCVCTLAYH
jgi:hypothetical protein